MATPFLRPDRGTPSTWEAPFLERRHLTLESLEFGLPLDLASSAQFVAYGVVGNPTTAVYSSQAFENHHQHQYVRLDDDKLDAYILPHLPLEDATSLHQGQQATGASYRVANLPRLSAKLAALNKMQLVRSEALKLLRVPADNLPRQLLMSRAKLRRILEADDSGAAAAATARVFPLDTDVTEEVLRTWEGDLAKARAEATAARRRVILAVHHATNLEVSDEVHVNEDVHATILHLAPEIHQTIYGDPAHNDPCTDPEEHDDQWEQRQKRTEVELQKLMRSIGLEMKGQDFVEFSLPRSRRDLIECEGEVTQQELRVRIMRTLHQTTNSLASMTDLVDELIGHLRRPTLLGNKVHHLAENLPMHTPFYPTYANLSEQELEEAVKHHTTATL